MFVGVGPISGTTSRSAPAGRVRSRWLQPINPSTIDAQLEELARLRDIAPGWIALAKKILEPDGVQTVNRGESKAGVTRPDQGQLAAQRFPDAGVVKPRPHVGLTVPANGARPGNKFPSPPGGPRPAGAARPDQGHQPPREIPPAPGVQTVKTCSKCKRTKSGAEFYNDPNHGDGMSSACKPCMRAQASAWARAHPERRREIQHRHNVKRWARQRPVPTTRREEQ